MQTGNPEKLEIVATYPADRKEENKYHKMLLHLKQSGEWFKWNEETEEIAARWLFLQSKNKKHQ